MPVIISDDDIRVRYSRLMGELRAERDIARARPARACFQRDALLFVVAGLLFGIAMWSVMNAGVR